MSQAIIAQAASCTEMLASRPTDTTGEKAGICRLLQNPKPEHPYRERNDCDNNRGQA